jgi:hypothetical protein
LVVTVIAVAASLNKAPMAKVLKYTIDGAPSAFVIENFNPASAGKK